MRLTVKLIEAVLVSCLMMIQAVVCRRSCLVCCQTPARMPVGVAARRRRLSLNSRSHVEYRPTGSYAASAATATQIRSTVARCSSCAMPRPEPSTCSVPLSWVINSHMCTVLLACMWCLYRCGCNLLKLDSLLRIQTTGFLCPKPYNTCRCARAVQKDKVSSKVGTY